MYVEKYLNRIRIEITLAENEKINCLDLLNYTFYLFFIILPFFFFWSDF